MPAGPGLDPPEQRPIPPVNNAPGTLGDQYPGLARPGMVDELAGQPVYSAEQAQRDTTELAAAAGPPLPSFTQTLPADGSVPNDAQLPGQHPVPALDIRNIGTPVAGPGLTAAPTAPLDNEIETLRGIARALGVQPERLAQFKLSLTYIWQESLDLTGLTLEALLQQISINAANRQLPAQGSMDTLAGSTTFLPTKTTLDLWVNSYFNHLLPTNGADMAEA